MKQNLGSDSGIGVWGVNEFLNIRIHSSKTVFAASGGKN